MSCSQMVSAQALQEGVEMDLDHGRKINVQEGGVDVDHGEMGVQ